jgi:RNA polymerase sigma-70 factor (ECF subfamily)
MQRGDMGAFDVIFDRYRRRLLAFVYSLLGDRGLAQDIVQECFVELARRVGRIDPERGVAGWLHRVARNRAIDVLRRRRKESWLGEETGLRTPDAEIRGPGTPAEQMARREDAERVRQALAALSVRDREILSLRFYAGLTFKEIAGVLRRPLGTVLWQGRRSLHRLRRVYAQKG